MAEIIGNAIFVKIGSNIVVGLTAKSASFDAEMQEVTDQNSSGGWREFLPGYRGGKIGVTGWYDEAATEGAQTAFANLANGTTVSWKYGENGTAKTFFSGSGLITSLTVNGNGSSPSDYTFDIQVTGKVSRASTGF